MKKSSFLFASITTLASFSRLAYAGLPACPASLGGYETTVTGNTVVICPTVDPNPTSPSGGCPYTTGMIRIDVATGDTVMLPLQSCVPAPSGSPAVNCFEDECVPPGTYQYGYQTSPFFGCDGECVGPTSGELATVASVSNPLSSCTPTNGADISVPSGVTPWSYFDAGATDGGLYWSGTCCAPAPAPDGGSCAYVNWKDSCAVEWAPCDADAGDTCPGFFEDGGLTFGPCDTADAGAGSGQGDGGGAGDASNSGDASSSGDAGTASTNGDAGHATTNGDAGQANTNGNAPTSGGSGGGGGCSVTHGVTDSFAPCFLLSIVGLWGARRRGRAA